MTDQRHKGVPFYSPSLFICKINWHVNNGLPDTNSKLTNPTKPTFPKVEDHVNDELTCDANTTCF